MSKIETRVIQVTNISPSTTKDQLKTLFQFIGRIREVRLFPPEGSEQQVVAKVCYIEFDDSTSAGVSLHLTNTVFIDRALIVVPVMDGKIPDEKVAMQLTPQAVAKMSQGQPSWPANVVSQVTSQSLTGSGSSQAITTYDPRLNALGLPQYPPLPANLDAAKVEEIRRTVYIGNLDPKTTGESLLQFFSQAGEVKYVRMAGDESSVARGAYLELTDQRSVATCLGYNGVNFNGRVITVSHSKTSIAKPLTKSQEASRREIEEAMKKVKEAQSLISAAAADKSRSRSRSRRRSRSRGYSRSRSRSRGRRSQSRSRRHHRSRSRSKRSSPRRYRAGRSRSRSPTRRRRSRSRSGIVVIPARERRRSRSASRNRRRSRTKSPKRRSRTPPKAYAASRRSRSREGASHSGGKKDASEATADKKPAIPRSKSPSRRSVRKSVSRSPVRSSRKRTSSRSPGRASRRRSPSPRKRRSKSRSKSPSKKKKARSPRRSRSGSRHRSKKDKKKERSRSRERKEKKKEKKGSKEKVESKEKVSGKVTRDYDEEEKGYNSTSDHEMKSPPKRDDDYDRESDRGSVDGGSRQPVDMDTSD